MAHQLVWLLWMAVLVGRWEQVSSGWVAAPGGRQVTLGEPVELKHKRQVAVELAFSRLRILESLDGQLRHWTARVGAGEPDSEQQQQVCQLPVNLAGHQEASQEAADDDTCPVGQVPSYMLNLQRMIVGQASSRADAVRLMPYGSMVARSFRQPQPGRQEQAAHWSQHQAPPGPAPGNGQRQQQQQLVVELSVTPHRSRYRRHHLQTPASEPVARAPASRPAACTGQQLCYWFPLNRKLAQRINGSLESPGGLRERLVEAELHLYKLAPKLLLAPPSTPRLKTDLLEVSLYQILARGRPPRLLDIRRIDLNSIGWETFYARRALQDWVREPALNLGLVIKAKSMFKEPIGPGLMRFADLWRHHDDRQAQPARLEATPAQDMDSRGEAAAAGATVGPADESWEFNLSHQPTLVIYTSTIEARQAEPSSK